MNTRHHYLSLLRTFALATLTAAAVTACTDDNGDPAGSEPITPADGIPVTFTANINPGSDADPAGAPDTRTVLTPTNDNGFTVTWKGKDHNPTFGYDEIRIWAAMGNTLANSGRNKTYVPATSEASSVLEPKSDSHKITLSSGGEWNFTAIYGTNNATTGKTPASISPLTQSEPGNTAHIAKNDFSVATAAETVADNSEMPANISFKFKHMLSALQLQVKNGTGEALTVNEIRLSVIGEKITSDKNYGVIAKGWIDDGKLERDYLQLKIQTPAALASNATEPQKFHMLLFPGYENKTLIITVITDHGEYTLTKGAPTGGFLAGKNYLTDITITSTPGTNETWTETISTPEQLAAFRNRVNGGDNYTGKTVRLTKDIPLTGEWTPIGSSSTKNFRGTFDGGGYHISGLNVDNSNADYAGLFGYVVGGKVRNLRVSGNVTTTGDYAGGIAGQLQASSTVENCIFSGTVNGRNSVGGIAGFNNSSSRIAGCHTKGSVTATASYGGGIAGSNFSSSSIDGCYSEAEVTAAGQTGGIVGENQSSTVTHCYAMGKVSGSSNVGGIAGYTSGGTFTGCIALNPGLTRTSGAAVTFGRIVGINYNNAATLTSCAAFNGMAIKDVNTTDFYADATGEHGTALTREQCLTKNTYTGFAEPTATKPGWAFDAASPWTYLPWNSAFETFSDIQSADYRIEKAFTQP